MNVRLVDYHTGAYLRPARKDEVDMSERTILRDGLKMLIFADNRICYIDQTPNPTGGGFNECARANV